MAVTHINTKQTEVESEGYRNSWNSSPGTINVLVFKLIDFPFLSQLRSGGGKPVTSQVREMKLFTTTVKFSGLAPTTLGGTVERNALLVFITGSANYSLISSITNIKLNCWALTMGHIAKNLTQPTDGSSTS